MTQGLNPMRATHPGECLPAGWGAVKVLAALALTAACALWGGCTTKGGGEPSPRAISPSSGGTGGPTPVIITGDGFLRQIKEKLDSRGAAEVGVGIMAALGGHPLSGVTFSSSHQISAVVPERLPPGVYAVTVTNPDGKTGTLPDAFTVYDLDHFSFGPIGTQMAGTPFSVTVMAYDASGNLVTGYNGPAAVSDATGAASPSAGSFSGGVLILNEVVCAVSGADVITVTSGGVSSSSQAFTVTNPADAGGDRSIPTGGAASLGTPAITGYTYSWSCGSPPCSLSDPSLAEPVATPLRTTIYTVAAARGGCSMFSSATVTVNIFVTFTFPQDGAVNSPDNSILLATFSEPLVPSSLSTGTFWLADWTSGSPVTVAANVSYDAGTATAILSFSPAVLTAGDNYLADLSTAIVSVYGNTLASDAVFGFIPGGSDVTAPTISSVSPAPNATLVPLNAIVTATYDEYLDPRSVFGSTITVYTGTIQTTGTIAYDIPAMTVVFLPSGHFTVSTDYTATAGGVTDLAGNPQTAPFTWVFSTGFGLDVTPPTVAGVSPTIGATGVPVTAVVAVNFDEAMNPLTISPTTFYLQDPIGNRVAALITYSTATDTAYLTPMGYLNFDTVYTVVVTGGSGCAGVQDLVGNCMAQTFTSSFTTGRAVFFDTMEAGGCSGTGITTTSCWTSALGWSVSSLYSKSPTHSYGASSRWDAGGGQNYTLTTAAVSLTTGIMSLSFWERHKLFRQGPTRDFGIVTVQPVGMCSGTTATLSTISGVQTAFTLRTYGLSAYAGCTVEIIFTFQYATNRNSEWYVDDVLIQ